MWFNSKQVKEEHLPARPALVRDPLCDMQIDPRRAADQETVGGQTHYFCSRSCASKFRQTRQQQAENAAKALP